MKPEDRERLHALLRTAGADASRGLDLLAEGKLEEALDDLLAGVAPLMALVDAGETDPRLHEVAAGLHNQLGSVWERLGDLGQAQAHLYRAYKSRFELDPQSLATGTSLQQIGRILRKMGNLEEAEEWLNDALSTIESVAEASTEHADCLALLGLVSQELGRMDAAMQYFRRALSIDQAIDAASKETARDLNNIGALLYARGELDQALIHLRRALSIDEAIDPDSGVIAIRLDNLGLVHEARGELDQALGCFTRAYEIGRGPRGDLQGAATSIANMGALHHQFGDLDKAATCLEEALEIDSGFDAESPSVASHLGTLGVIYRTRGDFERAVQCFDRALRIMEATRPDTTELADAMINVGTARRALGELGQAQDFLERALTIYEREAPRSPGTWKVLTNLAGIVHERGDLAEAIRVAERAVGIAESLRERAGLEGPRERVFASHITPYHGLISLLYRRAAPEDVARAFDLAEQSRARVLADLLAESGVAARPETDQQRELLARERHLRFTLAALHRSSADVVAPVGEAPAKQAADGERHALEEELESVVRDLRESFPAYRDLRYPEPLTLAEAGGLLEPDTLLLEYAASADETFFFAVRAGALEMRMIEASAEDLGGLLDEVLGGYRRGEGGGARESRARRELAELILDPVTEEAFEGVSRVLISADGPLSYLPFEMLPVHGGELLGDRYLTSYTPSMTVFRQLMRTGRETPSTDWIGFGDPDFREGYAGEEGNETAATLRLGAGTLTPLPGTRAEVERIATLFSRPDVVLGREATEYRAKAEVGGHRLVHFATHGVLDDRNPLYSGLVLASPTSGELARDPDLDDFLQAYEMFGLPLRAAEVVVCSACQTGLGLVQDGEGLVGLSRALLYAGARCVVLSLWPVPDLPTARLMARFYEGMRGGKGVAAALQDAKRSVRQSHPSVYRDPYTWSAFVPVGLGW
jgi:CHAT domain-containing protein/tetratricopeptide (TPR) repeat protein